jgi:hypothetical protein
MDTVIARIPAMQERHKKFHAEKTAKEAVKTT